ncbi:hypothetical protein FYJ91_12520 [Sphingomonas montanisoli]|uniref:MoeA N-terminal and linker domain-containing protein n=1 Tax=Sphingomonas montanisoli TaxID=2606412 RepID=A0A5D9C467_9SPHN|nr:hypothetical protein FYJ91_12520 [Sphingomonas montanisoli]
MERLIALVAPLEPESAPIVDALGRSTTAPVLAASDQPRFDAATMDGQWATMPPACIASSTKAEPDTAMRGASQPGLAPEPVHAGSSGGLLASRRKREGRKTAQIIAHSR